ncbi:MAG: hypothetical protein JJU36_07475 [Phycisphaeraceae bacterium]|nr:hypothetical protein [Phycisphaeraceae bacterium]
MNTAVYRFTFDRTIRLPEAEQTLHLAVLGAEGLFGEAQVRMDLSYHIDEPRRVLLVDGSNKVGAAVIRMFTALLLREIGSQRFTVRRVPEVGAHPREAAA